MTKCLESGKDVEGVTWSFRLSKKRRLRMFRETAEAWPGLGLYERFEQAVALVLAFLVGCVIVVAIAHLVLAVGLNLFFNRLAPLDHGVFQAIFGMIMTVLIALKFNHTILSILHRKDSIIQLRTVILIALLAVARKFIIIDFTAAEPLMIIGLAFAVLALGSVYLAGAGPRPSAGSGRDHRYPMKGPL